MSGRLSVSDCVYFCIEEFLGVMKKSRTVIEADKTKIQIHRAPFEAVVAALAEKYKITEDSAHDICKPIYWILSSGLKVPAVLRHGRDSKGSYWRLTQNNVKTYELANAVIKHYEDYMREGLADLAGESK